MTLHAHPVAETQTERELREIDALMRSLVNLRHWVATKVDREPLKRGTDEQVRLYLTADRFAGKALRDTMIAAAALFDSDELYVRAGEVG